MRYYKILKQSPVAIWASTVYFDSNLLMRTHTVSKCFVVLSQLRQIRCSVPTDTFKMLGG